MPVEVKALEEVGTGTRQQMATEAITKSGQSGRDSEPALCGGQERLHGGCRLWSDARQPGGRSSCRPVREREGVG